MVNGLREPQSEHLGPQPPLHDLGGCQAQYVIELPLRLEQQTHANHAAQKRITLKHSLLAFLIKCEKLAGCGSNLGQGVIHSPDLTLVLQAVLSDDFHLPIKTLLLERPLRLTESLTDIMVTFLPHGD